MAKAILPKDVLETLNRAGISFVLVGAYGLAGWRKESRATEDVDVVVSARQLKKAEQALLAGFRNLESVDLPVVIRLRDKESQDVLIDIMKPMQQPYRVLFRNTRTVTVGNLKYRIPSLEMAIVMKFAAMTSLHRAVEDKYRDASDFVRMVKNNSNINLDKVAELASLMYEEDGKDAVDMVRRAQADEILPL